MTSYFLDTNIIFYAVGKSHAYKKACEGILEKAAAGEFSLVTNAEVLQELLYRYVSIGKRVEAISLVKAVAALVDAVFPIDFSIIEGALALLVRYRTLHSRDAIHVASMLSNGVSTILSADRDFDRLSEITRVDPIDFPFVP